MGETGANQSHRPSLRDSTETGNTQQSTTTPLQFTVRMKQNLEDHTEKDKQRYMNTTLEAIQEQVSDAQDNGVEPVCFRPQVVNRPNWYLDSDLMVIKCRDDYEDYMSRLMRKPTICIGENKDADQLRGNREADQRLCFRYTDSILPLLLKSEISSL